MQWGAILASSSLLLVAHSALLCDSDFWLDMVLLGLKTHWDEPAGADAATTAVSTASTVDTETPFYRFKVKDYSGHEFGL